MKHHPELSEEHFETMENAASALDCTGLIPSGITSDEEIMSYEELYHFLPPDRGGALTPQLPDGIDPAPQAVFKDAPPVSIHDTVEEP